MSETTNISLAEDVLGITNPLDRERSFAEASSMLGHELITDAEVARELEDQALQDLARDEWERAVDSQIVHELLEGEPTQAKRRNMLTDWPVYLSMLQRFGRPAAADQNARALLVGSLTPISSVSFVDFSVMECNAASTHVVDEIPSTVKARHGIFEQGNALDLAFTSGSIDFVFTNHLLTWLHDPADKLETPEEGAKVFLSEAVRVLAPGGQMFLDERIPESLLDHEFDERYTGAQPWKALIRQELGSLGMEGVVVEPSLHLNDLAYLYDAQRNFASYPFRPSQIRLSIFARKPADVEAPARALAIA